MCHDVGELVVRHVARFHSVGSFEKELFAVAGSVLVIVEKPLASRMTSTNSVHACEAASVRSTRKRAFCPQNDDAELASDTCHACGTVAPPAMEPIASAPGGERVTFAPGGCETRLSVACTPAAVA